MGVKDCANCKLFSTSSYVPQLVNILLIKKRQSLLSLHALLNPCPLSYPSSSYPPPNHITSYKVVNQNNNSLLVIRYSYKC